MKFNFTLDKGNFTYQIYHLTMVIPVADLNSVFPIIMLFVLIWVGADAGDYAWKCLLIWIWSGAAPDPLP